MDLHSRHRVLTKDVQATPKNAREPVLAQHGFSDRWHIAEIFLPKLGQNQATRQTSVPGTSSEIFLDDCHVVVEGWLCEWMLGPLLDCPTGRIPAVLTILFSRTRKVSDQLCHNHQSNQTTPSEERWPAADFARFPS